MIYSKEKFNYSIKMWVAFMVSDLQFPEWQRENCWTKEFEAELILSILGGIDLPKLYIGSIKDANIKYIMDGGHRSRTIKKFHDNEFSVPIDGVNTYYNKISKTRKTGCLTSSQRSAFDDYHLDVVIYKDISTNDCRKIFNILQNAQPMSIYDVINSYQSDLVDYSRVLLDIGLAGYTIMDYFRRYKFIQKPDKTKVMTKLICWFSILNPILVLHDSLGDGDDVVEDVSLKYLTEGNNKNSSCLTYIKRCTEEISEDQKLKFIDMLDFVFNYFQNNRISPTDLNTLIHARANHTNFSIEKFNDLLTKVSTYEDLKRAADKLYSDKKYDESTNIGKEADSLNDSYSKDLSNWLTSRHSGGNNPSGMRKRYEIVKHRCFN